RRVLRKLHRKGIRLGTRSGLSSISGPALLIEDYTAPALRTDQPFAAAGVAKPERPTTDRSHRHHGTVARALGLFARHLSVAEGALLVGRVVGRAGAHPAAGVPVFGATWITIFPNWSPRDNRSNAAGDSDRGNTRSTGGTRRPARSWRTTASYSASLPIVEPMIVH